jgi:hypothetical protein
LSGVNDKLWDRIRDRLDRRVMTRYEYAALSRYWRVRRYGRRHAYAHGDRLIREAEQRLVFAVGLGIATQKWRPLICAR